MANGFHQVNLHYGTAAHFQLQTQQPLQLPQFQLPYPQLPPMMTAATLDNSRCSASTRQVQTTTSSRCQQRLKAPTTSAKPQTPFTLPVPTKPVPMTQPTQNRRYHPYSSRLRNNSVPRLQATVTTEETRKLQRRKDAKAYLDVLGYLLENGRPTNRRRLIEDVCGGRSDRCYSTSELSVESSISVKQQTVTSYAQETQVTSALPKKAASQSIKLPENPQEPADAEFPVKKPSPPEEVNTNDSTTWELLPVSKDSELFIDSLMYWCRDCGRRFSTPAGVVSHMTRNPHPFSCSECGKDFSKFAPYWTHLRRHEDRWVARCDTCDVKFYCRSSYARHMRLQHNDVK